MSCMKNIVQQQVKMYQSNFITNGPTPKGLFWNNFTTQKERYRQLINPLLDIKDSDFSICDFGAGLCHLHEYLNERNIKHNYTGIEIVPEMNEYSKEKHKNISIIDIDFLDNSYNSKFDFLVLSGTLNLKGNISTEQWEEYVFEIINP